MKTIQIAPYVKDCRIEGNKIIGTMGTRTIVFELPKNYCFPKDDAVRQKMIRDFCDAIGLSSYADQAARLLNSFWQIKGGRFYEMD